MNSGVWEKCTAELLKLFKEQCKWICPSHKCLGGDAGYDLFYLWSYMCMILAV